MWSIWQSKLKLQKLLLEDKIQKYDNAVTTVPSLIPKKDLKERKKKQKAEELLVAMKGRPKVVLPAHLGKAIQEVKEFEPAPYIYVSGDGDGIGAVVEQKVMSNDLEGIIRQSEIIKQGQAYIKTSFETLDGKMLVHGGDDNLALVSKEHLAKLEDIRQGYQKITGFTVTFGVGNNMRDAVKALVYGKLTGKDKLVFWDDSINDKLKDIIKPQSPKEKYEEHGLLPQDIAEKSDKEDLKELIEEHKRLVGVLDSPSHKDDKEEAKRQKKELKELKDSGEYKPVNKIKKKAEILKGAMRRLAGNYVPHKEVSNSEVSHMRNWQEGNEQKSRQSIPRMESKTRIRALHHLSSVTPTRRSTDGKREFLLHRGTDKKETTAADKGKHYSHEKHSSWSPKHHIAANFAGTHESKHKTLSDKGKKTGGGGGVMSAWVHENDIHHVPKQVGATTVSALSGTERAHRGEKGLLKPRGSNEYKDEHEVIVRGGHKSSKASKHEVGQASGSAPRNLDAEIQHRHQKVKDFKSPADRGIMAQAHMKDRAKQLREKK